MKRPFFAALLSMCAVLLFASPSSSQHVSPMHNKGAAGGVTWTVIQHPHNFTCSFSASGTHACTVTNTQNTTAGNLLILHSSSYNNNGAPVFVSASGDGSWTHCPSAAASENYSSTNFLVADCAYILSATGGAATVTFNWSTSLGAGNIDVELIEVHRSTGAATYDTDGTATSASCSSCVGPTLTLGGSSEFIAQWGGFANAAPSAISGAYSNPFDTDNANVFGAFAGALNQSSGTGPTWTVTAGGSAMAGVAFK